MTAKADTSELPSHIRINLGGEEYKDSKGEIWHADKAYTPGSWGCMNLPQTDVLTTTELLTFPLSPRSTFTRRGSAWVRPRRNKSILEIT